MKAKIIVATHKKYDFPEDDIYMPLHAGKALAQDLDLGIPGDDTGDNISSENRTFCELTCLYWAWKNLPPDIEIVGLCHYRRYFAGSLPFGKKSILSGAELEKLLAEVPVVVPTKRKYYIESNYSQYSHAHHEEDLRAVRNIFARKYSGYMGMYRRVMRATSGHRYNMFIMRRRIFDAYCSWLFEILFDLRAKLDISNYSDYDRRVFGFVGERLLDVWLSANHLASREVKVVNLESQHYFSKITSFLLRWITGGKAGKR